MANRAAQAKAIQVAPRLPLGLKLAYSAFVAAHVIVNWQAYGPLNFLWICDVAVLTLGVALWAESPLLLSTAAVGIGVPLMLWGLDLTARILSGHYWLGFAGYMFDRHVPAAVRITSTFHVWLPVVLGWALWRLGYDRRAVWVQCAVIAVLLVSCRFISSAPPRHGMQETVNINWVYGFGDDAPQTRFAPAVYLGLIVLGYQLLFYLPSHVLLSWCFKVDQEAERVRNFDFSRSPAENDTAWAGVSTAAVLS